MVYYCSSIDAGQRLGLNSAQRTAAASRLTSALRRASIDIDQEFRDYGRNAPSREQGESTTSGAVNVGDTTIGVVNANDFGTSGNGNIDGDSFIWTGKDGAVSALTIAAAGANYQAGTLSATGGTGSGFTGTYGISATTSSYSISGTNTTCQAGNLLVNGVSKGAYTVHFKVASISLGGTNQNADASDGSDTGTGTFTLGGGTGGTFTVNSGVISNIQISSTAYFASAPAVAASGSTSFGDNTLTAVLASTGQLQAISVSDTTKYASTPTVTSSSSFGNATVAAVLNNSGIISSVNITNGGVYTVAPTAIATSHSGDDNGSITPTFTFNRLTGVSNISADHLSGVAIQDGEMAHVLREVCADLAAAYYMEDEGTFFSAGDSIRGNLLRERGTMNLRRIAHLGSVD
tara:strand:+ start:2000 stop:3214 length:1215 start_codon:yes stop_codon:yes gene_type:complete